MTTYGIVEKVIEKTGQMYKTPYYKYKVRLPLFHGYNEPGSTEVSALPEATYAPLPHSENTKLNKGDLVVVSLINYNLDDLVILGLMPNSETKNLSGTSNTESGTELFNIKSLSIADNGTASLPYHTRISIDKNGRDGITPDDLAKLSGIKDNIQSQIDDLTKNKYTIKVLTKQQFNSLRSGNNLEKNTIYFVYNNQT